MQVFEIDIFFIKLITKHFLVKLLFSLEKVYIFNIQNNTNIKTNNNQRFLKKLMLKFLTFFNKNFKQNF